MRHISTSDTRNNPQRTTHETRLHGYSLFLARTVWVSLVLLTLVVFFMGIPQTFKMALSLQAGTLASLRHMGLSANFYASYIVIVDTITFLGCLLFAVLILYRRSDDWMVMFVGLTLLLTAMLYTADHRLFGCSCRDQPGSICLSIP